MGSDAQLVPLHSVGCLHAFNEKMHDAVERGRRMP